MSTTLDVSGRDDVTLRTLELQGYKGFTGRNWSADLELAPLTILVGPNNAGKTALSQAIQLLAGGLAPSTSDEREPLPLESGGIRHGYAFEDLVTGRAAHGRLRLAASFAGVLDPTLRFTVRNVMAPGRPPERQIDRWRLKCHHGEIDVRRLGYGTPEYDVTVRTGARDVPTSVRTLTWRGLIPQEHAELADWTEPYVAALRTWATGIRHLSCPRRLIPPPLRAPEHAPMHLGNDGRHAPLALAADDALRGSVREWYRKAFGVRVDLAPQGRYFELVTGTPARDDNVRIEQAGQGLAHVLPVVVTALTAPRAGPGVDIIEHPEAELHPRAHADVAELLLSQLVGPARPLVVETHSEMLLLRARRWVAEGKLPADDVLVYWIEADPPHGSVVKSWIRINDDGEMPNWPEGVFIEDYEEFLAIRRAARARRGE